MKLKFKIQAFQTQAVKAITDCFLGQTPDSGFSYRLDPGNRKQIELETLATGFRNKDLTISSGELLENIRKVQRRHGIPDSAELVEKSGTKINLDIEMETGTGKTYCYIKTIFELNRQYGWSKFVIVVPSIAIREGIYKSLEITADHFFETYHKKARYFIYNSRQLHQLESFSSDSGINVMIINIQAFNAKGKDARRIYEELDDFQSRKPIDVIRANRPILILDEPQKMEGNKTLDGLRDFSPLAIFRYSATHKTTHNKVFRLDALDAYQQKLVKKIAVRGITVKGLSGTNSYLFLESILISRQAPVARLELEVAYNSGIKRLIKKVGKGDNLFTLSNELDQYKGFVVSDINGLTDTISFTNGVEIRAGEATGDVSELTLRRIQIREAIKAHLEKERDLFPLGIKVLTLFFIDEVAKYRVYNDTGEVPGIYGQIFEEEYKTLTLQPEFEFSSNHQKYLNEISAEQTHNGYFSIDKKTRRLIDPEARGGNAETDDVDAYDLILKDKEKLLSFSEPTRFIFSHSALREGWDNPNVFVICTLKHSDNTVTRRQEVGRGLRLSVNQMGDRQDHPATVHQINVLTVVANESYKDFVTGLQSEMIASLSERPRLANEAYFKGKVLKTEMGDIQVTDLMARRICHYLIKNNYVDENERITPDYHEASASGQLAELPEDLKPVQKEIFRLVNSVFSELNLPQIADGRRSGVKNPLNENFNKAEFRELWSRINKKVVYRVEFESDELIRKAVASVNMRLRVTPLEYVVTTGTQASQFDYDALKQSGGFITSTIRSEYEKQAVQSVVSYDLVGKISEHTELTRRTLVAILKGLEPLIFGQFRQNPEQFITDISKLINEQKATVIIERLIYNPFEETFETEIFTQNQLLDDPARAGKLLKNHIYDFAVTDSKVERQFVEDLDVSSDVVVYAKLPRGFHIPTPVGDYNPDWAIAFKAGSVKHIYFVAETKGSLETLQLKEIEQTKIACARKFFDEVNKTAVSLPVRYDVIDSYSRLMDVVKG